MLEAKDIFAGPIVRRAQPDMVSIWLATRNWFTDLAVVVRPVGDEGWLGVTSEHWELAVLPNLYVHLFIVEPYETYEIFPTNTLLEYSIVGLDFKPGEGEHFWDQFLTGKLQVDLASFEKIALDDKLSYDGLTLPTFYLQDPDRKLCALYASCRKFHGKKGGDYDALALGDDLIAGTPDAPWDFSKRPAVLALTGDQIYADDVHDDVFVEVRRLAKELAGDMQEYLDKRPIRRHGRKHFVQKMAGFKSGHSENHLLSFAEYAAMYGLAWCPHNWSGLPHRKETGIQNFQNELPKVRRLMANTPTYMTFDDHDVTDDWNLSLGSKQDVWARPMGRRIVANALYAFWLFQACGNDPDRHRPLLETIRELNDDRVARLGTPGGVASRFERFFWSYPDWEYSTPTRPFIYFLDTRTQRGHRDGRQARDSGPPAFLKSIAAWRRTMLRIRELLERQSREYPLVLVSPAPVLTLLSIPELQRFATKFIDPYILDLEQWPNNLEHLLTFFRLCGDRDVVILSGDVHYGYTSTARVSHFDDEAFRATVKDFAELRFPTRGSGTVPTYQFLYSTKFLQLTSSASHNYASSFLESLPKGFEHRLVIDNRKTIRVGTFHNGELRVSVSEPPTLSDPDATPIEPPGHRHKEFKVVKLEDYKPTCAYHQLNSYPHNAPYLQLHNVGYVVIERKKIGHLLLSKSRHVVGLTWDFANDVYWRGASPP
ncbi:MAG: hypothetical protein ACRETY_04610 [Steroidobacteraceae bacterium]